MNKRQKKKQLKFQKKYMIKGIEFLEKSYTIAIETLREDYEKMPEGTKKMCYDFHIGGIEYATKMMREGVKHIEEL